MVGRLVSGSSSVPALLYFHIVVLVALVVADDALPQFLYPGGCFAAVVMLFGGCFALFRASCLLSIGILVYPLCRFISSGDLLFGWKFGVSSPCCLLSPCCRCVFLCAFLRCLSVVSSLCTCVGQVVFGRIKIVSVVFVF